MQPIFRILWFCRCLKQRGTEALESTGHCSRKYLAQGHNGNSAETQPQHSPPARIPEGCVILNRLFHSHNASGERMSALKRQWITRDSTDLHCPLNTLPFVIMNLEWSVCRRLLWLPLAERKWKRRDYQGPTRSSGLCLFVLSKPLQTCSSTGNDVTFSSMLL